MDDLTNFSAAEKSPEEIKAAIEKIDLAISKTKQALATTPADPKESATLSRMGKKLIATVVAMCMLLGSFAFCTYAYFTESTSSSGNVIITGEADVSFTNSSVLPDGSLPSVDDAIGIYPGYTVSKNVYAQNNGTYPIYVRAAVSSVITLDEKYANRNDEIDYSLILLEMDLVGWQERDGYYYYTRPIGTGEATTSLISQIKFSEKMGNIYKDGTIKVTVLLEAVQANNNGATVFEASGWASAGNGGAS